MLSVNKKKTKIKEKRFVTRSLLKVKDKLILVRSLTTSSTYSAF